MYVGYNGSEDSDDDLYNISALEHPSVVNWAESLMHFYV